MNKDDVLKEYIEQQLDLLNQALQTFQYTLNKAKAIGIKEHYNFDELDIFESLSSKFARISDILTQKVLKSIFMLLREEAKTFLDRAHLAEKLSLVGSADDLKNIRDLRNEIAHEYCIADITVLFESLLTNADLLMGLIKDVKAFSHRLLQ